MQLTARIWQEDDLYVSQCVELDIASQGETLEEAFENLKEAVGIWFEHADKTEVATRALQHAHEQERRFEVACG